MLHAYKVLEFDRILSLLVAQCENERAAGLAGELSPSFDPVVVTHLQQQTAEAYDLLGTESLPNLGRVGNYERQLHTAAKGGVLDGGVLWRIGDSLTVMRLVISLARSRRESLPALWPLIDSFPELKALEEKLLTSLDPDGEVLDDASPELARARKAKNSAASRVLDRIQAYTNKNRDLLSDPIYTQREGRYVIPLKSEHRGKIRGIVHDTSASGQTIFLEPSDVVDAGNALREAEAAERAEVARVLLDLSSRVGNQAQVLIDGMIAAAELDLVLAKAKLGYEMKAVAPRSATDGSLWIQQGRHPLLDPAIAIPVTLDLGQGFDGLLITGPNTGGKTVAIKTVGLYVLMNQCGMMVPAGDAGIGVFSQVWADIGDEQSLQQSLSTFSGHIKNIAEAAQNLKPNALVLLDEVGAGTDPAEGAALARSILLHLHSKGAKIMASTHYGELKLFAFNTPRFMNAAMEFDTKSLKPTYRLLVGAPGASHALRIAERYGLPKSITEAARESADETAQDVSRMLEKLEITQKQAQKAQSEADRLTARLKQIETETSKKLTEAEEARRDARKKAAETLDAALREIRLESQDIFDELKANYSPQGLEKARQRLKDMQSAGSDLAEEMRPAKPKSTAPNTSLHKGMSVRSESYKQVGTVLEPPKGDKVLVQMGLLKMSLPVQDLTVVTEAAQAPKHKPKKNLGLEKAQSLGVEIQLIGMRAEVAEDQLTKFLDDAILAGYPSVRIVHGKGEGILRNLTALTCRKHRGVSTFREGEPGEGGAGVTIAYF